jgi:hypothetical protein
MTPLRTRFPAFLVCLALLLSACDSAEPPTPAPFDSSQGLIPLAVGNAWTYAQEDFIFGADTFEVRITGSREVEIGSRIYTVYEEAHVFSGIEPPFRWLIGNEPDGLYRYGGVSPQGDLVERGLAYPHPARDAARYVAPAFSYNTERGIYQKEARQWEVVAADTVITVGAETRSGTVYRLSYAPYDDVAERWNVEYFVVPGLGLVREQLWSLTTLDVDSPPRLNSEAVLIRSSLQ